MIDFSAVREITIPEGPVLKIVSGNIRLWERSVLPVSYQQTEYIATDGNQYIDTGVLASDHENGIKYVFRGNITDYQSTALIYWFGALADGRRSGNVFTSNTLFGLYAGGSGSVAYIGVKPPVNTDIELIATGSSTDAEGWNITLNGGEEWGNNGAMINSAMPDANIHLFTAIGTAAATTANRKYYGKLYSFTMDTADGIPIRNFVPCYRKTDGEIGLYDTVEGIFYTNQGTGFFTKGPDIST